MPKKLYNVHGFVLSKEDKNFVIRATSTEVAERIVELWNKKGENK